MRKIFLLLLISLVFLFVPQNVFAFENFSTAYDVSYTVSDTGTTHVILDIDLTNTTSRYYVTSYSIDVGFDSVYNVAAQDPSGKLSPKVIEGQKHKTISVDFNTPVAGIGKKLPFTISFDTDDVAHKEGSIWEVDIPGLLNQKDFESFKVSVNYPQRFGTPQYVKPNVSNQILQNSGHFEFTKEDLKKSGVSLAFGDTQTYAFQLKYHLKNKNLFSIRTEIALPPNTNYQQVYIDTLDPKPTQVTRDSDGNWLAEYKILPSKQTDVVATGFVDLSLIPKIQEETDETLAQFTKQNPYWESENPQIQKIAKTLKNPRDIYDYVVNTLSYDFARATQNKDREGALKVLQNPKSAVCLEFTDLFIALARASGIPAREVNGFAYTENETQRPLSFGQDILHAWPEYYNYTKKTWVMVDPTWGNTTGGIDYFNTLDFDHIAFVIKGKDSTYPIPAGGYKLIGDQDSKDVDITFAKDVPVKKESFTFDASIEEKILSGLPVSGEVTIQNTGNVELPKDSIFVNSLHLLPRSLGIQYQNIPPYGFIIVPFSFQKTPLLTNRRDVITIQVKDKSISKPIEISLLILNKESILIGGGIIGIFIVAVFAIAYGARSLPIFR